MFWKKFHVRIRKALRSERNTSALTWISGIAGLMALILWGIGAARHISDSLKDVVLKETVWDDYWAIRYGIVAVCVFLIFCVYSFRTRSLKRRNTALIEQRELLEESSANATKIFNAGMRDIMLVKELILTRGPRADASISWAKKRANECTEQLCTEAARKLSSLTGNNTRVCLKELHGDIVIAKCRSERSPESTPDSYTYSENTAFDKCVRGRSYYLNNFLLLEDDYLNANTRWRELYDATLVLKIENPDCEINQNRVYGFICADNIGGNFDSTACLETQRQLGAMCWEIHSLLSSVLALQSSHAMTLNSPPAADSDEDQTAVGE